MKFEIWNLPPRIAVDTICCLSHGEQMIAKTHKFVIPSEVLHNCDSEFTGLFPFFSDDNYKPTADLGEAEYRNEQEGKLTHEQIIWRPRVIMYNFLHNES